MKDLLRRGEPIPETCREVVDIVNHTIAHHSENGHYDTATRCLFDAVDVLAQVLTDRATADNKVPSIDTCDGLNELRSLDFSDLVPAGYLPEPFPGAGFTVGAAFEQVMDILQGAIPGTPNEGRHFGNYRSIAKYGL